MSPGRSVGMNEYFWPHWPQNPRSRVRGRSQRKQKRLLSGTFGSVRIDCSGSAAGSSGTEISPAPRFFRELLDGPRETERREPDPLRSAGEEPVAVETAALLFVAAFGAARPQMLQ